MEDEGRFNNVYDEAGSCCGEETDSDDIDDDESGREDDEIGKLKTDSDGDNDDVCIGSGDGDGGVDCSGDFDDVETANMEDGVDVKDVVDGGDDIDNGDEDGEGDHEGESDSVDEGGITGVVLQGISPVSVGHAHWYPPGFNRQRCVHHPLNREQGWSSERKQSKD